MTIYEKKYLENGKKLPYYKPFQALDKDHETLKHLLDNPKRIIDTPCFRQYQGPDGRIMPVEEWMKEMSLYEFETLDFKSEEETDGYEYFISDYDYCIPAFNEDQAKLLLLAHIASYETDSILADPVDDYFCEFGGLPELKKVWDVTKYDEFIPQCYWTSEQKEKERYYEKDESGLATFYLDFHIKYAFERGLVPKGDIPDELYSVGGAIYYNRFPILDFFPSAM